MKSFHQHMWHRLGAQHALDAVKPRHAGAMCVKAAYVQRLFAIEPERAM